VKVDLFRLNTLHWGLAAAPLAFAGLAVLAVGRPGIQPAGGNWASSSQLASLVKPGTPQGHDATEGLLLQASDGTGKATAGARCPAAAPARRYRVAAINVDITLNRFLDHDPRGRMYVLEEELARVRREEAQNLAARQGRAEPAVTPGLGRDAIQPLAIRVNQGECLRVSFRNALEDEPASFHLHGGALVVSASGRPAIATEPEAVARPGGTVEYEWMVGVGEPEGTHYVHSHGNTRAQTSHGLFGGVIVEPRGSRWLEPSGDREIKSGWAATIQPPAATPSASSSSSTTRSATRPTGTSTPGRSRSSRSTPTRTPTGPATGRSTTAPSPS
jgi:hypothetical protein